MSRPAETSGPLPPSAGSAEGGHIPATPPAANYIDIKIHEISNLPASWVQDSGPAPVYPDHVFRYELAVSVAGAQYTFKNGRLLQNVPLYADYISAAELPPFERQDEDTDRENPPDIPKDVPAEQKDGAEQAITDRAPQYDPSVPNAILWVLGPDAEAEPKDEGGAQKKDVKAAPKKGAAAAATTAPAQPVEAIKPIAPNPNIPPPCCVRIPVTMIQLATLEEQVEKFVPLELRFRRLLKPNCPTEWEDMQEQRYQAHINVSLKALTEPGSTEFTLTAPLEPHHVEAPKEDEKGKKKSAPKKAKGTAPACLTEDLDAAESHPYVANKTQCVISIKCAHAITRLPQARPRPQLEPSDMIPKRVKPPKRPVESTKQFASEVEKLAYRILKDYRAHINGHAESLTGEEARASFLNYLNASGQAHAYKELLIPTVQGIVKEKFIRHPDPSKEEMNRVSNELYTYLLDNIHLTLNRAFHTATDVAVTPMDEDASDRWRRLAMEAEVMQEYDLAARYHQERIVQPQPAKGEPGEDEMPNIWCEYAEYCLRIRDTLKAEQAYRESLALNLGHLPSLIGYGALLLSRNRFKEAEVFLQSAVDIEGNTMTWGCVALYYDVLLTTLNDSVDEEVRRTSCRRESKYAMTQAVRTNTNAQCTVHDVYFMLAQHLLELHLEDVAHLCLQRCPPSATVSYHLARLFQQTRQCDEAISILKQLVADDPKNCNARLLLGDVYSSNGNSADAEVQYDAALRVNPQCGNGPAYVRLGNMYIAVGKYKDALGAFLMGAKAWPCGLTWLGVGIAYYRMDDLVRAEQALNESNLQNNLNPKTWAYLALVCLRVRREEEGDQAFNQAVKQGLGDSFLVAEVGVEQMRLGRHKIAEACFRRSISIKDDANTHMLLARTLLAMHRHAEAHVEFTYVASHTSNATQKQHAEEQAALIAAA